jgi:hypothetical protein
MCSRVALVAITRAVGQACSTVATPRLWSPCQWVIAIAVTGFTDTDLISLTIRRADPGEPPPSIITSPRDCSISSTLPTGCRWNGSR